MLIDADLFYLAGVMIGDGHLSNNVKWKNQDNSLDYAMIVYSDNRVFLDLILDIFKNKTQTKTKLLTNKNLFYISVRNKKLYYTFNSYFGIPNGKKSDKVLIKEDLKTNENLKYLLAGLFDTDGGFRRNSIGYCSASEKITLDIKECLSKFKINSTTERWLNKKYNKYYYGLVISKKDLPQFFETIPLKNKEKLDRMKVRFMQRCRSGQTG